MKKIIHTRISLNITYGNYIRDTYDELDKQHKTDKLYIQIADKTSRGKTPLRRLICSAEYDSEVTLNVLHHVSVK